MELNKLELNIYNQLGSDNEDEFIETLKDVCRGGANAGFSGFTYSSELLEFYNDNKKLILEELKELASDMGIGLLEMIAGFNCLKGSELTQDEIAEIVYGNSDHECKSMVIDALCWAVLENTAFKYDR
jgi:sugar phosphate isomerase/epimerase